MTTSKPVIGIDEAGRGPVLGPLIVGIVVWENNPDFDDVTIRDSKKMNKPQRESSFDTISRLCSKQILTIPAWVIASRKESLPMIEAHIISQALKNLNQIDVLCDYLSSGDSIHSWIRDQCPDRTFTFESEADDRYDAVSAASILAKVTRDRIMEDHSKRWGPIGTGYPSDPSTRDWLENWYKRHGNWPNIVRTNWSTVKTIEKEIDQKSFY